MNFDLIECLAKAINQGKHYHVFQGKRYIKSFYMDAVASAYKQAGYTVILL